MLTKDTTEYHKIQTVWLRDPETKHKTLLAHEWSKPEFGYLAKNQWMLTEKVDGTNIRLHVDGGRIGGRTDNAQIPTKLLDACNDIVSRPKFKELSGGMVLYGEGYGAKIQKGGGNYREDQGFVLFDVWCGLWLERGAVEGIAESLGIDVVPIIERGTLWDMVDLCREGFESRWGPFGAEGIVARPETELLNRHGERVITKLKCKDFR